MAKEIPIGYRFKIEIPVGQRTLTYPVIKTWETALIEHYMLMSGNKVLLFHCNRPELRAKDSREKIKWVLLYGDINQERYDLAEPFIAVVMSRINAHIVWFEGYNPGWTHPKNL